MYKVKFTSNIIVVAAPGILSFIIKYADAGCPPVADGVIAEKYMSDDEYTRLFLNEILYPKVLHNTFNANASNTKNPLELT